MRALAFLLLLAASPAEDALHRDTDEWHATRVKRLTAEDGWLTLVNLHWLEEGRHRAGSAADAAVTLPESMPAHVGTFVREGFEVRFLPAQGVALTREGVPFAGGALRSDENGAPDVLQLGTVRFHLIRRGDKLGVRVKDSQALARKAFEGIPRYPVRATYRVQAKLLPAERPTKLRVPTVLGTVEELPSPGVLVFTLEGKEQRLSPVWEEDNLFIIFADPTNRSETYGAGRFLYAEAPKEGMVTLDFNRAYNPPCAFSKYATCPLPPPGNRLSVRIEAGEKRYPKRP
ncbi:MAG: DUF1684 domain-containing protein [Myxococcota bacterium]